MPMRPLSSICACALALSALSPAAAEPSPLAREPYAFKLADGSELSAERGRFTVPEDRSDPGSRHIEIGFVRLPSLNPNPGAPIVYLAGGPGGSGVAAANGPRQPIFLKLREVADVIILDQRGTGLSNQVTPCTASARLDPAATLNEQALTGLYQLAFEECIERWRKAGVAVSGYDTEQSADDLEALRLTLGVPRIDLWAISYGTHLAAAAMRRHPKSIGRVVMASAEGMDQTVKLPARVDVAFQRIEQAAGFPLINVMRRVHARFDAAPQTFSFVTPDGAMCSFAADSFPLRMLAASLPKNPDGIPQLAAVYGALDAGELSPIAPLLWNYFHARPLTLSGMPELMDLASGVTQERFDLVVNQAPASLLGTATNFPMPQLAGLAPELDLGDDFRREVRSTIPVLLLAGDLDMRTPLEEQLEATAGFENRHIILVRNGGHDLFEAHPVVPSLLSDFFAGNAITVTELTIEAPVGE